MPSSGRKTHTVGIAPTDVIQLRAALLRLGEHLHHRPDALGAGAGQAFIGDSTTVLIYKLARAAVGLGVRRIVVAGAGEEML